jgi:hypothetical protein
MLTFSPVLLWLPRPGILVARRLAVGYRVWDIHRIKLRRPGGLC